MACKPRQHLPKEERKVNNPRGCLLLYAFMQILAELRRGAYCLAASCNVPINKVITHFFPTQCKPEQDAACTMQSQIFAYQGASTKWREKQQAKTKAKTAHHRMGKHSSCSLSSRVRPAQVRRYLRVVCRRNSCIWQQVAYKLCVNNIWRHAHNATYAANTNWKFSVNDNWVANPLTIGPRPRRAAPLYSALLCSAVFKHLFKLGFAKLLVCCAHLHLVLKTDIVMRA